MAAGQGAGCHVLRGDAAAVLMPRRGAVERTRDERTRVRNGDGATARERGKGGLTHPWFDHRAGTDPPMHGTSLASSRAHSRRASALAAPQTFSLE
jgi:hypothetical protein